MDIDNSVIYILCRRHVFINFKNFIFLCVILVMHFSEKRSAGISRLSKEPMAIKILRKSNLAECRMNTYKYKKTGFMNKDTSRAGLF
jgi:hypothetical protein